MKHTFTDIWQARSMSVVSGLSQHAPRIRDFFAAPKVSGVTYVPLRWRYSVQGVNSVPRWVRFHAEAASGSLPRNYRQAGILSIGKANLEALEKNYYQKAREAVAFQLGSTAVMVGVAATEKHHLFRLDPEQEDRYFVAMRIGKGQLLAAAGVWVDSLGFIGARDIGADTRLPVSEIPPHIAIV